MNIITLAIAIIGALTPQPCPGPQSWQYIEQAQIWACTTHYPAKVSTP